MAVKKHKLEMAIDEVESVYDELSVGNRFHDHLASGPWSGAATGARQESAR